MSVAYRRFSRGAQSVYQFIDTVRIGIDEPTWENSGCRIAKSNLKKFTGTELVTSYDGQVIENLYLPVARIRVQHKNVTIRNCYIEYGPPDARPLIHAHCGIVHDPNYDTRNNVIEYVTLDPINAKAVTDTNDANVYGIYGYNLTVRRCAIRNVTDAVDPDINTRFPDQPPFSTIIGNYLETRYLSYDPGQTDGTHNDGVQIPAGNGYIIRGNAFHNPPGTSQNNVKGQNIVCTPYHGAISNVTVEQNWFYGAYTQIAAWPGARDVGADTARYTVAGLTLRDNIHSGTCTWPILINTETDVAKTVISGNIAGADGLIWNNGFTAATMPITEYVAASH